MATLLENHLNCMGKYLKDSGNNFDRAQVLSSLKRYTQDLLAEQYPPPLDAASYKEYRILNARKHKYSKDFLAGIKRLMTDEDAFDGVALEDRTEAMQALAFKSCSTSLAHHHESLYDKHENYPFLLFDALEMDEAKLARIEQDMKCPHRLDAFAAYILTRDGTAMDVL